jgi:valyl-tRNA synthetase
MISRYPEVVAEWSSPEVEHEVELLKELIHGARSLRTEYHVGNNVKAVFYYSADSDAVREVIARHVSSTVLYGTDLLAKR